MNSMSAIFSNCNPNLVFEVLLIEKNDNKEDIARIRAITEVYSSINRLSCLSLT